MGIKDLNQLLKRICGSSHISHIPMCNFDGQKIAVDAALYVCIFKMRGAANYVPSIVEFLTTLRENRIHPFFVFDGVAPEEKHDERSARSEKRASQRERIQILKRELESYKQTGVLSELLKGIDFKTRRLAPTKVSIVTIQEYIEKLEAQMLSVTSEDFETMKILLDLFGINYTTASGEGEFLCAALNRHGLVAAVMTADTDVFPCLAPTVINKIDSTYFQVVCLHDILKEMKMTESQFIDLCIMCGTDFNKTIPRIGIMSAYELILRYQSIENLPSEINTTPLNYVRVRELFSTTDNRPEIEVPWCRKINYEGLSEYVPNTSVIKNRINKFIIRV